MSDPTPTMHQIEQALIAWAAHATGLPTGQIIWRNQNGPRPARPFVTLRLQESAEVGQGYMLRTDSGAAKPSNNLTYSIRGQDRWRVTFDAVTDDTVGNGNAMELLRKIKGVSRLPTVRALLEAVPIGVSSFGPIISLDALENRTLQLSRATMECVFYAPTEHVETGTTIETAPFALTETP